MFTLSMRISFISLFVFAAHCAADTYISFESPLPSGLAPMGFIQDTSVPQQARITNQYGNLGVLMTNVALVNLGTGQATSGTNGIAPISGSGILDYGSPVSFTFVDPLNNTSPATTDYFAISTDRWGGSGNTTTVTGYDMNGNRLGSVSHLDTGGVTLTLQGIGKIHNIVVQSILLNHNSGGIALDDVRFGTVSSTNTPPQPVVGGPHTCSNASLAGNYGFTISGGVQSGSFIPFAEAGSLSADGNGNVSGSATASQAGQIIPRTFNGTYTVNLDCTGIAALSDSLGNSSNINFVILDNGREINFMEGDAGAVISGVAKPQASGCTIATMNGGYGYAVSGWTGTADAYVESGKVVSDGAGNLSLQATASQAGTIATGSSTGTYSVNSDCTGTATFTDSFGSYHLNLVVVDSGREVQFIQTDSGITISGSAKRLFGLPSDAIVNAASFSPNGVTPGSLFSIFGNGLATGTGQAKTLPLPNQLGGASVQVNGHPVPMYYVNPDQINAQMPLEVAPGPAQLKVTVAGTDSQMIPFTVAKAGPGIFTYGQNRAVVVNRNGQINDASTPAHVGEIVVAYLTGGGPVHGSGWLSGNGSPAGASAATLPVNISVGNQVAQVQYLGLTPGFVGLYQANFTIPKLPSGDHAVVVNVNGQDSNASNISIVQ